MWSDQARRAALEARRRKMLSHGPEGATRGHKRRVAKLWEDANKRGFPLGTPAGQAQVIQLAHQRGIKVTWGDPKLREPPVRISSYGAIIRQTHSKAGKPLKPLMEKLSDASRSQIDKHLTQVERRARTERGQMKAFSLRVALNNPKFATPKAHRALRKLALKLKGK